jgi:hypothetical protein
MTTPDFDQNSEFVTVFRERVIPEPARPAGYATLIDAYDLSAPLPHRLCAIGKHHQTKRTGEWQLFTPRHAPDNSLEGHLVFALKWEGLDLLALKRLFVTADPEDVANIVRNQPTGSYARRIWFLYEWLTGLELDLPDTTSGRYVPAIDPSMQYAAQTPKRSKRHRVFDNLPGTRAYCPLVFVTQKLEAFIDRDLAEKARDVIKPIAADILARAAAFLLLDDSKSSFAIENEKPSRSRIARWGNAIGQAGKRPISIEELVRLQHIVIEDSRFVTLGLRKEGGFIGEHDRLLGTPIPAHISARAEDLGDLLVGLIEFTNSASADIDAVIAAACTAFGFVYIHPFEDGNGRIHRYLLHHVLAERKFNPPGMFFPVSSVILRLLDEYKKALESHSSAILPLIDWEATDQGNVDVENDTADFYRYFDATPHAEFLYHCVEQTIVKDLPEETRYLKAYDRFADEVQEIVDLPQPTTNLLFRFLRQSSGKLSERAKSREFAKLTEDEIVSVEAIYASAFEKT